MPTPRRQPARGAFEAGFITDANQNMRGWPITLVISCLVTGDYPDSAISLVRLDDLPYIGLSLPLQTINMYEIERRRTRRFSIPMPLSVVDDCAGTEIRGVTRDVSSSGVSLFSSNELAVGAAVTFNLELPFEVTLTEPVRAHCRGHVVRLEPQPDGRGFVIAVRLYRFEFVSEDAPA